MTTATKPIRAGELLNRAALEICLCRALVSKVEHSLEEHHDSRSYPDLQGLDLLHQTLGDIATLLRAIAEASQLRPLVIEDAEPLIAPLRLGAVRARLRSNAHDAFHAEREHHVELF